MVGSYHLNLVLIKMLVSEKMSFTDGWTTNASVTTVALLCSSITQS